MGEEGLPKRIRLEWEIIMKEEEWKWEGEGQTKCKGRIYIRGHRENWFNWIRQ